MKRTAIAIAVGALSIGLTQGLLAQDDDTQLNEQQQMTQDGDDPMLTPSRQSDPVNDPTDDQAALYSAPAEASGFGDGDDPMSTSSRQTDPINDPTATATATDDDQAALDRTPAEASSFGDGDDPMSTPSRQTDPINDPTIEEDNDNDVAR
ncbi:hypothetical protein [Halomonas alkalisoli]|uniref:hypothetical protein n=1 Tax=Halomonas alkalisoli TaxID=2907158 RepID=UPI001F18DEF8|nr:hypothetical protein [Halomonas alkalisoli]MCE9681709.1 hypothetical protein [Halomonas alkalisoli]